MQVSGGKRDTPWLHGARHAAGTFFDTLLTKDGKLLGC